ncbi:MAG: tryptophan--tRNA ligase [Pseudomonadota bacterium]
MLCETTVTGRDLHAATTSASSSDTANDRSRRKPRLVSGIKASGRLHLGNLEGVLRTWVSLQGQYESFLFVADWHTLTTAAESKPPPPDVRARAREVAIDFLAAGIDPANATVFIQSAVKQHAELALLLGMITPVAWLERVPTYRDLISADRVGAPSFGLLGYPVLQTADILLYRPEVVPVGRDQLPHLELAREVARRFNHVYERVFVEPHALLSQQSVLPGVDGRKMSKSYDNAIYLADSPAVTAAKIMDAFTTPTKLRRSDPGMPESCVVCQWRRIFDPLGYRYSWEEDRAGRRGCIDNKRELVEIVNDALAPLRARRRELSRDPVAVDRVLAEGAARASVEAEATMDEVRRAMRLE